MMEKDLREAGVVTFEMVIERLVEAWGFLRRMPDRERGWLRDTRSPWPEIMRHSFFGDYPDVEPEDRPRLPGLRAAEVDRMNAVLGLGDQVGWIEWVPERDRKLMAAALQHLHRGEAEPGWTAIGHALYPGLHRTTLARRFERAVSTIAVNLNRAAIAQEMAENAS